MQKPVTVVSSNFISLLTIICLSFSIHLIVRYRELLAGEPDMPRSIVTLIGLYFGSWLIGWHVNIVRASNP